MLQRHTSALKSPEQHGQRNDSVGLNFFYFKLSEKNHEIVLPIEQETTWEQLHEITWDPGRGD